MATRTPGTPVSKMERTQSVTPGGSSRSREEKIVVTVRLRPLNKKEQLAKDQVAWECDDHTIVSKPQTQERSHHQSSFTFDKVFGPESLTENVYEDGVKNVALSALMGINGSPMSSDSFRFNDGFSSSSSSSSKKKKKHKFLGLDVSQWDAEDPPLIMTSFSMTSDDDEEPSLSVNTTSTGPRILELNIFNKLVKPDPKIYLDAAWAKVNPAITAIFLNEPKQLDPTYIFRFLNDHPTAIFNAVRDAWWANSGETLYKMILNECETHISRDIESLEVHCNEEDPSVFLSSVVNCWLDFLSRMRGLCDIARSGGHTVGWKELWQLGKELFPKQLFKASKVHDKVLSNILDLITDQRSGKPIDMNQLNNLMNMFDGPYFYKPSCYFEMPFVNCATKFYSTDSKQVLELYEIPQYLKYVEQKLHEEKEKCSSLYFFQLFREPLIKTIAEQLLMSHAFLILDKGFAKLMDESRHDDLRRMYVLFSEANLLDHMKNAMRSYILTTGEKIKTESSSSSMLLVQFKRSVDMICFSDFLKDRSLEETVKQCFKDLGSPPSLFKARLYSF